MTFNHSHKQIIYNSIKSVLDEKFEGLGNNSMKQVFGPQTQTLIREALHTYCFSKKIVFAEKGEDYIFKFPIVMPVTNDKFNVVRELKKELFA